MLAKSPPNTGLGAPTPPFTRVSGLGFGAGFRLGFRGWGSGLGVGAGFRGWLRGLFVGLVSGLGFGGLCCFSWQSAAERGHPSPTTTMIDPARGSCCCALLRSVTVNSMIWPRERHETPVD